MSHWHQHRKQRLEQEYTARQLEVTANTSDLVATLNRDIFFLTLNLAGFNLLGIGLQETIEQFRLPGFLDVQSRKYFLTQDIPNAMKFGIWQSEINLVDKELNRIPCSQVLVCHRDASGQVEYFSLIIRDIRKVKAAEQERIKLLGQLHEAKKMETVGRLAGGIAHDFNNFITIIIGYAELTLVNDDLNHELRNDLQIILDSAQKASRLTAQLLDYSSKKLIEPQVMDLNHIVREAEQLIRSLMGAKIDIGTELAEDLWYIRFDRSQLEQIIFNLAVNARDALNDNGSFSITTSNTSLVAAPDNLSDPLSSDYVLLTIKDSGSGIPRDIIKRIFEPFFTTKEKGTGMGLSAVHGAVKQNQSEIFVRSESGVGTTFTIYIPAVKDLKPAPEPCNNLEFCVPVHKGTLLLVEDNDQVLSLVSKLLSRLGYVIHTATNGLEGLERYQEEKDRIDMVITDIVMPGLDGYQLTKKLLALNPDLKVLLVSGHNEEIISFQQNTKPNVKMLNKPFSPDQLGKAIAQLLGHTD